MQPNSITIPVLTARRVDAQAVKVTIGTVTHQRIPWLFSSIAIGIGIAICAMVMLLT